MKDLSDNLTPDSPDPEDQVLSLPPDQADEILCPVCRRALTIPIPELCPHCMAPIQPIMAVLRVADLSVEEAMRDLRSGELETVAQRLALVKLSSKAHRLRAEIIQAKLDRLMGDPGKALARIRAIRDELGENPDADLELAPTITEVESQALDDQRALASCCEHYNFALFQAKRGHLEEARSAANQALGYVPHHAPSHLLLAKTHFALRESDDAKYHLERALQLNPSDVSGSRFMARMNRLAMQSPIEWLRTRKWLTSRWVGPIFILLILIFLGLAALLNR
jgi:tetratricopeptide (TPR) repeat protein